MSRRESQFMQITLILCVLIIVGLGVAVFVFYNSSETAHKERANSIKEMNVANKLKERYQAEVEVMLIMIGESKLSDSAQDEQQRYLLNLGEDVVKEIEAREAIFEKDMKNFEASYDGEKHYPALISKLMAAIHDKNQENKRLIEAEKDAKDELATAKAVFAAQLKTDKDTIAQRDGTIAGLNKSKELARIDFENVTNKLQVSVDTAQRKTNAITLAKEKNDEKLNRTITHLDKTIQAQIEVINDLRGITEGNAFVSHNGIIMSVSQRTGRAYVNLGLDDGLRRQTTFSIYDRGEGDVTKAKSKGTIEIIQINGPHKAVARITSDDISNPILAGDLIYSSVWKAGRSVTFALAGFLDVNGNGKSDRQLLHNLISANGGRIVAELDDAGNRTGKLSVETRFLIMGAKPTDTSNAKVLKEYTKMINEARVLGIEKISLDKLLDYMGYKGEIKTVRLGKRANSDDFRSKRDPVQSKSTGDAFRPRRPPGRGKKGAY